MSYRLQINRFEMKLGYIFRKKIGAEILFLDPSHRENRYFPSQNRPQMVQFTSYLTKIDLFGPQIDFLEPQNIFFWCLKCFKTASGYISHGIDQENGSSSEFPSLKRPQTAKFRS